MLLTQNALYSNVAEVHLAAGGILGISCYGEVDFHELKVATDGSLELFSPSAENILLNDYSALNGFSFWETGKAY